MSLATLGADFDIGAVEIFGLALALSTVLVAWIASRKDASEGIDTFGYGSYAAHVAVGDEA
ncbi:hypothetical protein ACKTEK_03525 [Tepidamorphus sp. 3E244]|uniref:hypothetical protein n=1 Tax=Tepidamorphus sp. 3E244 TaxID=3385498 RepID=UPI0038FC3387